MIYMKWKLLRCILYERVSRKFNFFVVSKYLVVKNGNMVNIG